MNLSGISWGGASQARKAVITKPGPTSNVAAGYSFEDGEGTELPIHIGTGGFGPKNGLGFWSLITTLASKVRSVVLADASGRLSPELYAVLAADATNSTTSGTAVPSFGVTLEASAIYEFEIILRCQTAAATTGLQFQITGPTSQVEWTAYEIEVMTAATLSASITSRQAFSALAADFAGPGGTAANTDYLTKVKGLLKTTSTTPASDIGITFKSETGGSQVTLKTGSVMRFRKINTN